MDDRTDEWLYMRIKYSLLVLTDSLLYSYFSYNSFPITVNNSKI